MITYELCLSEKCLMEIKTFRRGDIVLLTGGKFQ